MRLSFATVTSKSLAQAQQTFCFHHPQKISSVHDNTFFMTFLIFVFTLSNICLEIFHSLVRYHTTKHYKRFSCVTRPIRRQTLSRQITDVSPTLQTIRHPKYDVPTTYGCWHHQHSTRSISLTKDLWLVLVTSVAGKQVTLISIIPALLVSPNSSFLSINLISTGNHAVMVNTTTSLESNI